METIIIRARGQKVECLKATLLQMPYFKALLDGSWADSQDGEHFVNIKADIFHIILDLVTFPTPTGDPMEFIPHDVREPVVVAAAEMLGLIEGSSTPQPSDTEDAMQMLAHAAEQRRVRDTSSYLDCKLCGQPFDPRRNTADSCVCHPLTLRDDMRGCCSCGCFMDNSIRWSKSCYRGPHMPVLAQQVEADPSIQAAQGVQQLAPTVGNHDQGCDQFANNSSSARTESNVLCKAS